MSLDFDTFLASLCDTLQLRVDQLVFIHRPVCYLERAEFQRKPLENILREQLNACTGESALIESDIDTVRLSLNLKVTGDALAEYIHQIFYSRLARESIACIRKLPLPGYDITFIFDHHDRGEIVAGMVGELFDLWRTLEQLVRVRMSIGHRQAGRRLVQGLPTKEEQRADQPLLDIVPSTPERAEPGDQVSVEKTYATLESPEALSGMEEDDGTGFLLIN